MNYIRAFYYLSNNFGDNLNHTLIKAISGKECVYSERDKEHYIVCGSILNESNYLSTVWGAGFGDREQYKSFKHSTVVMTRGFVSADLLKMDFDICGDPALLMPLFYKPVLEKQYKQSIIPHWKDYEYCLETYPEYHIIDPFLPVTEFINEVVRSEQVACSGLHGLIIADTYNIPNIRVQFGDIGGDGIKFEDYYSTTLAKNEIVPLDFEQCQVNDYKFNLNDLLNTCPFYEP